MKYERITISEETWYQYNGSPVDVYDKLVELEDKIEQKLLIESPCKVGDKVYYFLDMTGFYDIIELTVEDIVIRLNPFKCILHCKSKNGNWNSFCDDSFGKELFFTKDEARAREKERLKRKV